MMDPCLGGSAHWPVSPPPLDAPSVCTSQSPALAKLGLGKCALLRWHRGWIWPLPASHTYFASAILQGLELQTSLTSMPYGTFVTIVGQQGMCAGLWNVQGCSLRYYICWAPFDPPLASGIYPDQVCLGLWP